MGFSSSVLDTLYHGESPFSSRNIDIKHEKPLDQTLHNVWIKEPAHSGVLTKDGVENIALHKYQSGTSTYFDDFCNPIWTKLTEGLPMWLAPNMVSTLGLSCLYAVYMITWYYTERLDDWVPSWVLVANGLATIAYYTLDCMDGKQARRTNTSSPLGQLFDHGVDCLGNLNSISAASAYLMLGGTNWFFVSQACLQFSFFMAQWEEYYTGILPHACGKWIGVTEINYGMGLVSIMNAVIDREHLYTDPLSKVLPDAMISALPPSAIDLQTRHLGVIIWATLCIVMVALCIGRVLTHVKQPQVMVSAICKLFSPACLAACPFLLPSDIMYDSARYLMLSIGLAYCLITVKLIFLSMAKMPYAVFQLDVLPMVLGTLWIRNDDRLTLLGAKTIFQVLTVWYLYRFLKWASVACHQICDRLGIAVFTIPHKKAKTE